MGAAVVMLREGFEASLVIGIVLAFLNRTGRRDAFATVWIAAAAAVALSVAAGSFLLMVGSELEGTAEAAWEAAAMLAAAALLTWMIFWMRRQARTIKHDLERGVERALARGSGMALALVVFVGVLREGVESALFLLGTVEGADALTSGIGAAAGVAAAAALGVLVYRGSSRLDLRRFFQPHERPPARLRRLPPRERAARARGGRHPPGERGPARGRVRGPGRPDPVRLLP
ncbi:MAG: FTR1 family protein [Gaiellaceae bacterium]